MVQFIAYLSCKITLILQPGPMYRLLVFRVKFTIFQTIQKTIVSKLLEGIKRIKKSVDSRLPITLSLRTKIVQILPAICYKSYEIRLFRAVYLLAFHGFLRIEEFSLSVSNSVHSIIQVSDLS